MCGCGGSTPVLGGTAGGVAPRRVEGGPGEPGYTWNGPAVPVAAPAHAPALVPAAPAQSE